MAGDGAIEALDLRLDWKIIVQVLPLAVLYAAAVLSSNVSFAYVPCPHGSFPPLSVLYHSYAQSPMYLLARIGIVPMSLILTATLDRASLPISILTSSLVAIVHLLTAVSHRQSPVARASIISGVFASVLTIIHPIVLLRTYRALVSHTSQPELVTHSEPFPDVIDSTRVRAEMRAFWLTLRYTSLFSAVLLLPIVLVSGEIDNMSRNCYFFQVKFLWLLIAGTGASSWGLLILTFLTARAASPVATNVLVVVGSVFQLAVMSHFGMAAYSWGGVGFYCFQMLISRVRKSFIDVPKHARSDGIVSRVLLFTAVLWATTYLLVHLYQNGSMDPRIGSASHLGVDRAARTNPPQSWINRPESTVEANDDYLGPRPHVDTVAKTSYMVQRCRKMYEEADTLHDGLDCLVWLSKAEDEYFSLPEEGRRASEQDPRQAEYADADGHGRTEPRYPSPQSATPISKSSTGTCAGPIIPFHVYWTGPATWRVELFIKSYLYTQNLPCSRLWLWVDCDRNAKALEQMLTKDPMFERFLPFVEQGQILVNEWRFPLRMPLPNTLNRTEAQRFYKQAGAPNEEGVRAVADGVVEDRSGQQWLQLPLERINFSPVVVSDAVRFVVLHSHGGLYCDLDILLLRDMRPLLLPDPETGHHAFAEQWAALAHPSDYNTAVISLTANSTLSSYLLHGGVRMGLNFHPRAIGLMAWKDGRNDELLMIDTAAFDPLLTDLNQFEGRPCTVPCHKNYKVAFEGTPEAAKDEWRSYQGRQLEEIPGGRREGDGTQTDQNNTLGYVLEEDRYPPNNRTLENFFRGAFTYHIHNQVSHQARCVEWLLTCHSGPSIPNHRLGLTSSSMHTTASSMAEERMHTARNGRVQGFEHMMNGRSTHSEIDLDRHTL